MLELNDQGLEDRPSSSWDVTIFQPTDVGVSGCEHVSMLKPSQSSGGYPILPFLEILPYPPQNYLLEIISPQILLMFSNTV